MENGKNEEFNCQGMGKPDRGVFAGEPTVLNGSSFSESIRQNKIGLNPYVKLLRDFKEKHKGDDVSPTVMTALSSANMQTTRPGSNVNTSKSFMDFKKKNI